ncbi:uncharacterized protein LOC108864982 [Galendromus occidentalis]|uniref:Uncharacterized protein LOC108864982 n=1 Tax=Galendromus occidentalis TaxID=34638 RepID=A0AAJ7L677_9ACAR|nr:uncharacterized protein LOC108864982 [Galendromus occidentalis]
MWKVAFETLNLARVMRIYGLASLAEHFKKPPPTSKSKTKSLLQILDPERRRTIVENIAKLELDKDSFVAHLENSELPPLLFGKVHAGQGALSTKDGKGMLQKLKLLDAILPTDDEVEVFKHSECSLDYLSEEERFLYRVASIPGFRPSVLALSFDVIFDLPIMNLLQRLTEYIDVCDWLMTDANIHVVLINCLTVLNYVNNKHEIYHYGFDLEVMESCIEVKSTGGQLNLLDCAVWPFVDLEKTAFEEFADNFLEGAQIFESIDLEEIREQKNYLKEKVRELISNLDLIPAGQREDTALFIKYVEAKLRCLVRVLSDARKKQEEVCLYFCERQLPEDDMNDTLLKFDTVRFREKILTMAIGVFQSVKVCAFDSSPNSSLWDDNSPEILGLCPCKRLPA